MRPDRTPHALARVLPVGVSPRRWTWAVSLTLLAVSLTACGPQPAPAGKGGGKGRDQKSRGFPVELVTVGSRRVEYTVPAVGTVEPAEQVSVVARVAGAVEAVKFAEGDTVTQDTVLVEIDTERYRLNRESADAILRRAEANLADARAGLIRRESLNKNGVSLVPAEDMATWRTKVQLAEAEAAQMKVARDLAALDERESHVRAHLAGVIDTKSVETGQYVPRGTPLAMLLRRDPLRLRFMVPEAEARSIKEGHVASFTIRGRPQPYTSRITHVGGVAEPTARMVPVIAQVDDPDHGTLRPGAFAEIKVAIDSQDDAVVVPQLAVRPSERGFLAYVVRDGKAEERLVRLGMRTSDGQVEVKSGLRVSESLVIRGADALEDGVTVRVMAGDRANQVQTPASSAPSPAASAAPARSVAPGSSR